MPYCIKCDSHTVCVCLRGDPVEIAVKLSQDVVDYLKQAGEEATVEASAARILTERARTETAERPLHGRSWMGN